MSCQQLLSRARKAHSCCVWYAPVLNMSAGIVHSPLLASVVPGSAAAYVFLVIQQFFAPSQYTDENTFLKKLWHNQPSRVPFFSLCWRSPRARILVTAKSARHLLKQDSSGGADSFVKLTCEGTTSKSPVRSNTISPFWESSHVFWVKSCNSAKVKVQVINDNFLVNSRMGETTLNVIDWLQPNTIGKTWEMTEVLKNPHSPAGCGTIVLSVCAILIEGGKNH